MSIVAPIVATSAIVPVLAGVLIDGERPGALQWVGIVAALAGVALASREPGAHDGDRLAQGAPARDRRRGRHRPLARVPRRARPSTTRSTGVAAARAVAVPILGAARLRVAARVPWRALPEPGAIGLLDTGANTAFAIATTAAC